MTTLGERTRERTRKRGGCVARRSVMMTSRVENQIVRNVLEMGKLFLNEPLS